MDDDSIDSWYAHVKSDLDRIPLSTGGRPLLNLNVSKFRIGDDGVKHLLNFLRESKTSRVQVLQLWKNNIKHEGGVAIAAFLEREGARDLTGCAPLAQLHRP